MTQFPLPLDYRAADGEADFFVSDANRDAVRHLDRWRDWPLPVALLTGPPHAGKSHLARIFARHAQATVIERGEQTEEALFHAWNAATCETPLLIVARTAARDWGIRLPDLASRLGATPSVAIGAPDDALLGAVAAKMFRDRGLGVSPEVLAYVLARIERSFAGVAWAVESLDAAALAAGRAVTVPLASEVLRSSNPLPSGEG